MRIKRTMFNPVLPVQNNDFQTFSNNVSKICEIYISFIYELRRYQYAYNHLSVNRAFYKIKIKHVTHKMAKIEQDFNTVFQNFIHDKTEINRSDSENPWGYLMLTIANLFKEYPYEYKRWLKLLNKVFQN